MRGFVLTAVRINSLFCVLGFLPVAFANAAPCIQPTDRTNLVTIKGDYIATDLLGEILAERNVLKAEAEWHGQFTEFAEISIDPDHQGRWAPPKAPESYVSATTWHEGEFLSEDRIDRCLIPEPGGRALLREKNRPDVSYTKISPPAPTYSGEGYFFAKLLNGCYASSAGGKICFKNGAVIEGNQMRVAELKLDASELGTEGNYLKVDGEELFWVLVPRKSGWQGLPVRLGIKQQLRFDRSSKTLENSDSVDLAKTAQITGPKERPPMTNEDALLPNARDRISTALLSDCNALHVLKANRLRVMQGRLWARSRLAGYLGLSQS